MYLVSKFQRLFSSNAFKIRGSKAIGLSYFKERGFTTETIEKFSLGYSPESWDALTKRL
jgi:DNA primase